MEKSNFIIKVVTFFCLLICINSCTVDEYSCGVVTTEAKPIYSADFNNSYNYEELSPNLEFTFNPLILPFKLKYSNNDGFFIEGKGDLSLVLPIGTFSMDYGVGSVRGVEVNGYKVKGGDYIVGLVDKRKRSKQFFVIKGHNRLKAVIEGKTVIDARLGYMELDITDAIIKEIEFIDNSKMSIVNTTDFEVKFAFLAHDPNSKRTEIGAICEIPPKSYRNTRDIVGKLRESAENNGITTGSRLIAVVNSKEKKIIRPKVKLGQRIQIQEGETCYIKYNQRKKNFYLVKSK